MYKLVKGSVSFGQCRDFSMQKKSHKKFVICVMTFADDVKNIKLLVCHTADPL